MQPEQASYSQILRIFIWIEFMLFVILETLTVNSRQITDDLDSLKTKQLVMTIEFHCYCRCQNLIELVS